MAAASIAWPGSGEPVAQDGPETPGRRRAEDDDHARDAARGRAVADQDDHPAEPYRKSGRGAEGDALMLYGPGEDDHPERHRSHQNGGEARGQRRLPDTHAAVARE